MEDEHIHRGKPLGKFLEKNTQKCALRGHFTVRIKFSLLGGVRMKIDLFDQKKISKETPNHPNDANSCLAIFPKEFGKYPKTI